MSTELVDRIFKRLGATYGASWDRSLGQTPIIDVKTVWAHDLAWFLSNRPGMVSIAWALDNLPDDCPNVRKFVALCRQAPAAPVPQLPEPKADPERVAAELAKLAPMRVAQHIDSRAWAKKILGDFDAGMRKTPTVLAMAREAVKS